MPFGADISGVSLPLYFTLPGERFPLLFVSLADRIVFGSSLFGGKLGSPGHFPLRTVMTNFDPAFRAASHASFRPSMSR